MNSVGTVDAQYNNLDVFPKGTSLNIRSLPITTSAILAVIKAGTSAGKTTGNYLKQTDGRWFQVRLGNNKIGYAREDVINIVKPSTVTESDAKDIINKLIESDKEVFNTLLRISPILSVLKQKNANTANYDKTFKALTDRLAARQAEIKNSKTIKWQAGLKKGYENMLTWFKSLYTKISGIGAVPLVAVVVGAVVGVGLSVTAYFVFKPKYTESQVDLKISSDLEKALATLEPETAEKVKVDLEKQIDDSYNQGKTDGTFSGMWNIAKPIAIAVGGFFLIKAFINSQSK